MTSIGRVSSPYEEDNRATIKLLPKIQTLQPKIAGPFCIAEGFQRKDGLKSGPENLRGVINEKYLKVMRYHLLKCTLPLVKPYYPPKDVVIGLEEEKPVFNIDCHFN